MLLLASIGSWAIIFRKSRVITHCRRTADQFESQFWSGGDLAAQTVAKSRIPGHHRHAHSIEAYEGEKLVGGLYGVSLRGAFFGESMFHRARDASKNLG